MSKTVAVFGHHPAKNAVNTLHPFQTARMCCWGAGETDQYIACPAACAAGLPSRPDFLVQVQTAKPVPFAPIAPAYLVYIMIRHWNSPDNGKNRNRGHWNGPDVGKTGILVTGIALDLGNEEISVIYIASTHPFGS